MEYFEIKQDENNFIRIYVENAENKYEVALRVQIRLFEDENNFFSMTFLSETNNETFTSFYKELKETREDFLSTAEFSSSLKGMTIRVEPYGTSYTLNGDVNNNFRVICELEDETSETYKMDVEFILNQSQIKGVSTQVKSVIEEFAL